MTLSKILHTPLFKSPLAIVRIWLGITFINHGLPGIFSADYMDGFVGMMEVYDLPMPTLMAYLSKTVELVAGICLVLGLFTRFAAALIGINMLFAIIMAFNGSIFDDFQGEISFTYFILALVLFLKGSTDYSLDRLLFK